MSKSIVNIVSVSGNREIERISRTQICVYFGSEKSLMDGTKWRNAYFLRETNSI